jgi:uncharacterized protein DUF4352
MSQPPPEPRNSPSSPQKPHISEDQTQPVPVPNYPSQSGHAPQQGAMSQAHFAPQGAPQQHPQPGYPGQSSTQLTGLPPLPQPGSLPKDYHFPAPSHSQPSTLTPEQPGAEMPNPPPTRPRRLRKGRMIVSVLVLVLLLASGVGAFVVLQQNKNHTAKPTAHVTATATATTQPATSTTGTLGQPLQAGPNWVATVTKVHASTTSDYPPKAGQTYLEINITLKNVSPNTQFVSSMIEFTLADNNGAQYHESVNDTYTRQAVDGHLSIGQTLTGQVAYEVPQTQHQFLLVFHYGLPDGSSAAVAWNITMQ